LKNELDERNIVHHDVFEKLSKVYNDKENSDFNTFFADHKVYCGVDPTAPSNFDNLSATGFSLILDFVLKETSTQSQSLIAKSQEITASSTGTAWGNHTYFFSSQIQWTAALNSSTSSIRHCHPVLQVKL